MLLAGGRQTPNWQICTRHIPDPSIRVRV